MMQNYRPFTGITPAVKILLILNIVMYFLSMFIDSRMHVDTAHLLAVSYTHLTLPTTERV